MSLFNPDGSGFIWLEKTGLALCREQLPNHIADDAWAEIFMKTVETYIWKHDGRESWRSFLKSVIKNHIYNFRRRRRFFRNLSEVEVEPLFVRGIEDREQVARIWEIAYEVLSAEELAAFSDWVRSECGSLAAVARDQGVRESTFRGRIYRAIKKILARLNLDSN